MSEDPAMRTRTLEPRPRPSTPSGGSPDSDPGRRRRHRGRRRTAPAARSGSSSRASTARSPRGSSTAPRRARGGGVARDRIDVVPVPGAFELPLGAMALAKTRRTPASSRSAASSAATRRTSTTSPPRRPAGSSSRRSRRACRSLRRAHAETTRPGRGARRGDRGNKGAEAARTALEMADVFGRLRARAAAVAVAILVRRCRRSAQSVGRAPSFGHNRSHSMVATKRRFNPNLQRVRILVNGAVAPELRLRAVPEVGQGREGALALVSAALAALEASRTRIDDLNVYPVPDGDTGTNMTMTVRAVVAALERDPGDGRRAARSLMGARGNSGVILSQLVRGASRRCPRTTSSTRGGRRCSPRRERRGLRVRAEPQEGTMLTVARAVAERAEELAGSERRSRTCSASWSRTARRRSPARRSSSTSCGRRESSTRAAPGWSRSCAAIAAHVRGEPLARDGAERSGPSSRGSAPGALALPLLHVVLRRRRRRWSPTRSRRSCGSSATRCSSSGPGRGQGALHTDEPGAALALATAVGVDRGDRHQEHARPDRGARGAARAASGAVREPSPCASGRATPALREPRRVCRRRRGDDEPVRRRTSPRRSRRSRRALSSCFPTRRTSSSPPSRRSERRQGRAGRPDAHAPGWARRARRLRRATAGRGERGGDGGGSLGVRSGAVARASRDADVGDLEVERASSSASSTASR